MRTPVFLSSGDLLADRRYAYAEALTAEGDHAAAADLLNQALALAGGWAPGWLALGSAEEKAGRGDAARAAFERAAALDPSGALGAQLHLARLQDGPAETMSRAYVTALFDQYAETFETHLVEGLGYRGPALLRAAIERAEPDRCFAAGLDLGCGTGLMARAISDLVVAIDGVDLSGRMVAEATRTGLYRRTSVADVGEALEAATPGSYDLILAADVFVYLGDLGPILASAHRVLEPSGLLAFTVQKHDGMDFKLGHDLRFSHSTKYISACLDTAGLDCRVLEEGSTRRDDGNDVPGLVVVAARA